MHPIRRLIQTASFRFAALYVLVFAMSALVLGEAIFVAARSNLEQQMASDVQTETAFLQDEYRQKGLPALLTLVQSRGREARALDYLVQRPDGVRLAGEISANPAQVALSKMAPEPASNVAAAAPPEDDVGTLEDKAGRDR